MCCLEVPDILVLGGATVQCLKLRTRDVLGRESSSNFRCNSQTFPHVYICLPTVCGCSYWKIFAQIFTLFHTILQRRSFLRKN